MFKRRRDCIVLGGVGKDQPVIQAILPSLLDPTTSRIRDRLAILRLFSGTRNDPLGMEDGSFSVRDELFDEERLYFELE